MEGRVVKNFSSHPLGELDYSVSCFSLLLATPTGKKWDFIHPED
jgi:hypothetical protein